MVAKTVSVILVVVICFGLVACGNSMTSSESTSTSTSAGSGSTTVPTKENITINFASVYTPDHPFGPAIGQIIDQFMKDNPGVTIERQISGSDDMQKKEAVQLASGTLPEVFVTWAGVDKIGKYSKAALDLTDILNADTNWKDGFIAGALDNYKVDGMPGIYAAPLGAFCVGFYYNKEMFQKANVQPPKTWKELLDVIAKLKATGVTPWALGAKDSWRAEHLASNIFYKLNGVAATKDIASRKLAYDSPQYLDMYKAYVILGLATIIFIYPLVYTLISSLKTNAEIFTNYFGLPMKLQFENYYNTIFKAKMGLCFLNSAFIVSMYIILGLLFSTMAAFMLARIYDFCNSGIYEVTAKIT